MNTSSISQEHWLKQYYYARSVFSIAWIGVALGPGASLPALAAALLII